MTPQERAQNPSAEAARSGSSETTSPNNGVLLRLSGIAALLAAVVFRRNWSAEFFLLRTMGVISIGPTETPSTAAAWFSLLDADALVGLILFNVVDLINYALLGILLLGLYAALRRVERAVARFALAGGWIGVTLAFVSSRALAMLGLSRDYAAAVGAEERDALLAAGEALLTVNNPASVEAVSGETIALLLVTTSAIAMAALMRHHPAFGRRIAWLGIAAEGIQMGTFAALALAPSPALLALPPSLAAPLRLVWYVMVGRRLLRLARGQPRLALGADGASSPTRGA